MGFLNEDNVHSIGQFRREGIAGNYKLKWRGNGFDDMIVLFGANESDIVIEKNNELKMFIESIFGQSSVDSLPQYNGVTIRRYNYKKDVVSNGGGVPIPDLPGYYVVYGCVIDGDKLVDVYFPQQSRKCVGVQAVIEIKQSKHYFQKKTGFLGRKTINVYSGYKRITIAKSLSGVDTNAVVYDCAKGKYRFPIPQDVIEKGGSFFVKSDENDEVRFFSNNPGITIRSER